MDLKEIERAIEALTQASPDRDIDIEPERLRTALERLDDPQPAITSSQLRKNLGLDSGDSFP